MSDLKSLKSKYPTSKVVISGHSLGAAIANFAYLDRIQMNECSAHMIVFFLLMSYANISYLLN